jgi:aldehyde dehydrogenase family 7 protein A1
MSLDASKFRFLAKLGLANSNAGVFDGKAWGGAGKVFTSMNPTTNRAILQISSPDMSDYERCVANMNAAQDEWSMMPIPARGEIVRALGQEFRNYKTELGSVISLEMGKIQKEGEGEVQEVIDMCDFACGLSRQLNGKVIPSERKEHALLEQWNP